MNIREFQVLVFPFRKVQNGDYQFAIFKRTNADYWQGIAGGGNRGESFLEAAKRESAEEAGVPESADYFNLESVCSIAIHHFSEPTPEGSFVIPEYSFAADCTNIEIILSAEHTEFRWVDYEAAMGLLEWDSNKTALWELNQRLKNHKMQSAVYK